MSGMMIFFKRLVGRLWAWISWRKPKPVASQGRWCKNGHRWTITRMSQTPRIKQPHGIVMTQYTTGGLHCPECGGYAVGSSSGINNITIEEAAR